MQSTVRESSQGAAYQPPPSVLTQIARLSTMPMPEINDLWVEHFGQPPPTHNRQFIERRLAQKIQEDAYRKVAGHLLDRNHARIQALLEQSKYERASDEQVLLPGTILTRTYRGKVHVVQVLEDGAFEYERQTYRSLSRIALVITGAVWSGPVFFGVKKSGKTNKSGKAKPKPKRRSTR